MRLFRCFLKSTLVETTTDTLVAADTCLIKNLLFFKKKNSEQLSRTVEETQNDAVTLKLTSVLSECCFQAFNVGKIVFVKRLSPSHFHNLNCDTEWLIWKKSFN